MSKILCTKTLLLGGSSEKIPKSPRNAVSDALLMSKFRCRCPKKHVFKVIQ